MPRGKKFTAEQIIGKLREAEVELSRGKKVPELCRKIGVTEQTYYRWKAKYGGLERSEMQRLKSLEDENRRLKQIVAEQTLDIQALKVVVAKKMATDRSLPVARSKRGPTRPR